MEFGKDQLEYGFNVNQSEVGLKVMWVGLVPVL